MKSNRLSTLKNLGHSRCLPVLMAVFGLLSAAHGQLTVTTNPGGASSAAPAVTTETFNEITNPAASTGTTHASPANLPNYINPGTITLTLSNTNIHDVGPFCGSPDTANSVTVKLADGTSQTYSPGTVNGGFTLAAGNSNAACLTFSSAGSPIGSVVSGSTNSAFEFGDVSFGVVAVPEPATWLGASLLLGGAGLLARRRKLAH